VKHLVACLATTAALAVPTAPTAILPAAACDALNNQALPAIKTAFEPVATFITPVFSALCTSPPPGAPTGAVAWSPSQVRDPLA
jgi:hypothetical protein